ncbi:hypothetical protein M5D96_000829 [Drosophila gunungcola]|uniref:Uncharacterized protein n=1 Tax=Drosophila gunungcola TaxID=103775 RepID=A0A9P9YX13_9MUSC|nr:hypothetical protein M5D96_000829 [Drosophila gunungcola]
MHRCQPGLIPEPHPHPHGTSHSLGPFYGHVRVCRLLSWPSDAHKQATQVGHCQSSIIKNADVDADADEDEDARVPR